MPVEKPILGHFDEILPFSAGNKLVTKPIFQSNSVTVVRRMYRERGFILRLIGNEALLSSYCHLETHFFPLWRQNGLPLGSHWQPNWVPFGYQLAPNWPRFTTKWVKRRGAVLFRKITYGIINICNKIVETFTIRNNITFCTLALIVVRIRDRGKNTLTIEKIARRVNTRKTLVMF